jgi:hypothetical protein
MLMAEGAGMTSDSDDLEQELRRNLKLRRELGAKAAKGKAALSVKQGGGTAYRLGWVLYWACLVLIGLYWAWWCLQLSGSSWKDIQGMALAAPLRLALLFGLPALVLYGIGRALRYILSGE